VSYCQLRAKGASLPSLDDFRRNSPQIQYLLLKTPAKRFRVELFKPERTRQKVSPLPRENAPQQSAAQVNDPVASRKSTEWVRQRPAAYPSAIESEQLAVGCELTGRLIDCVGGQYTLVDNLMNSELPAGVLGEMNRLELSADATELVDFSSDGQRMSDRYRRYIEKMLLIGLGAVTMSYSQFYYTWQLSEKRHQDPSARFKKMYDYLKRDKQMMAVKRRFNEELPSDMGQCMRLSDVLLVCDEGRRNWVYLRS